MPKIFINPGHCPGKDPGACGNGLREAEVALKIGERVVKYLQAVGYTVKLFQYDGLEEICCDSDNFGADLFVSIHCNAATGKARGTETFHSGSDKGRKLAEYIQKQLISRINTVDRGVKQANYYVLKYTEAPSVLVETAFIDNPADAKILVENEDDFARAIACGITDYFAANTALIPDTVDIPKTANGSKLSPHFDVSEFACHHCGNCATIHPKLIELLEKLRESTGKPLHVNSGYRCPTHNANVGGVPNSQHVLGTAADIALPHGLTFNQFKDKVLQLPFDGVGFYPDDFIHVDVRNGGVDSGIFWWG